MLYLKLKQSKNKKVADYLRRLTPGGEFEYAPKAIAEFWGPVKPRVVDPFVETKDGLKRVSSIIISLEYAFKEFTTNCRDMGVIQRI